MYVVGRKKSRQTHLETGNIAPSRLYTGFFLVSSRRTVDHHSPLSSVNSVALNGVGAFSRVISCPLYNVV